MKATFVPEFRSIEELLPIALRVGFFFADADPDITFSVSFDLPDPKDLLPDEVPEGYDPESLTRLRSMTSHIRFVRNNKNLELSALSSDAVFVWNQSRYATTRWKRFSELLDDSEVTLYGVDRTSDRMEGSLYIQALHDNEDDKTHSEIIEKSRRRFQVLFDSHKTSIAYLLGTGPSIGDWKAHDMSNGVVIACNTTILDSEMMAATSPAVVTFADPIFHFGCNSYAERFRAVLQKLARKQEFIVAVPLKYYGLLMSLCPSLDERTIAIPMRKRRPNINLLADFEVKTTANISTLLMIPIATTLAKEVRLLGFDGRSPNETYFWKHNAKTQFETELKEIKTTHPSFFSEIDFSDYYSDHVRILDQLLTKAEIHGKSFESLEATHVTPVRKRTLKLDKGRLEAAMTDADYRIFSINPDYEDDFGHYGPYDAKLREGVVASGGDFVTLASTGYEGVADSWVVPVFTDPSWSLGREQWRHHAARFEREFEAVLRGIKLIDPAIPTAFVMYAASPRHVVVAGRVATNLGITWPIHANLFHSHKEMREMEEGARRMTATGLALSASEITRDSRLVHVYADSDLLAASIERNHGVDLPLWPMFSFNEFSGSELDLRRTDGLPPIVYAPGNMQFEKGYDLVARLSSRMNRDDTTPIMRLRARIVLRDGTNRKLLASADVLRRNAEVVEGVVTDLEYTRLLMEADILLIPYRQSSFATRTSAVLADALTIGKPVVTTAGTWMGHIIEELGVGETFKDGDVVDMERALRLVAGNIERYTTTYQDVWSSRALSDDLRPFLRLIKSTAFLGSEPLDDLQLRTLSSAAHMFDSASYALALPSAKRLTDSELVEIEQKLRRAREQLRTIKDSVGYRLLQRVVKVIRPLGPIYNALHRGAARMTNTGSRG